MENKVENQKVTDFFENTVFACAVSKSKLLAYQEAVAIGCNTLRETYDDLVRGFYLVPISDFDFNLNGYGSLYEMYNDKVTEFNELQNSACSHHMVTKSNEDLTDENIMQLIVHIIFTYSPDYSETSRPRLFINLVSLLFTRFTESENDNSGADFLFKLIITVDDLYLYKIFYNMLKPKECTRLLPIHYNIAEDVLDKNKESRICTWLSPRYISYLRTRVSDLEWVIMSARLNKISYDPDIDKIVL